jgi:dTDP-4-amino-4,6-dideoxygalactose transaminase
MIPVCQPTVDERDVAAVAEVMRSRWLSTGMLVTRFEEALCEETGYPYAVALSSCTAALFLALKAYDIGPGSVVGVPALTFTATAAAVEHVGASVRFLDVNPRTWLLDYSSRIYDAVIPVNLYGQLIAPDFLRAQTVVTIEDSAHAIGASLKDRSETMCLSFYATKNITTGGEGGALLTRNAGVAAFARCASLHGLSNDAWARYQGTSQTNEVVMLGYKANMTDMQAAMGLVQLTRLEEWRFQREDIAARYDRELGLQRLPRSPRGIPHLYPVLLPHDIDRREFTASMRERGIGVGMHYCALTDEPYWARRYHALCPQASSIGRSVVSLPLYPHLTYAQQTYVIESVLELLSCSAGYAATAERRA